MISVAVCDDETYMADALRRMAVDFFRDRNREISVFLFSGGEELLDSGREIDILFLDIRMGEVDGLETALELRRRGFGGYLIFTTVLREMVFQSFAAEPFDYLVKPIGAEDFNRTMERLLSSMSGQGKSLLVQRGSESRIVTLGEIVYCEVMDRKIYLHLRSGETVDYYDRIDRLEEKLDRRFYRCHRSYLINLQYLRSYRKGIAVLESGLGEGFSQTAEMREKGKLGCSASIADRGNTAGASGGMQERCKYEIPISRLKIKEFAEAVLRYLNHNTVC